MSTVTLEITVWDAAKVDALIRKIQGDARVASVEVLDR